MLFDSTAKSQMRNFGIEESKEWCMDHSPIIGSSSRTVDLPKETLDIKVPLPFELFLFIYLWK